MEELVAELGSAFLSADLELTPEVREDHAAYIASWIKVLKNDKRAIFTAASHAQRATDLLNGLQKRSGRRGLSGEAFTRALALPDLLNRKVPRAFGAAMVRW
jgi:antirestriction protein ArdC